MLEVKFDHGTIVLDPKDHMLTPPDPASGILWDPRSKTFRAMGQHYGEVIRYVSSNNIPFNNFVPSIRPDHWTIGQWSEIELRPYQEAALAAWHLGGQKGVIVLPTGSGKTIMAVGLMARLGLSTLCLVPTRVLLHQWAETIGKFYQAPIGLLGDEQHTIQPLTVATFESAYRHMSRIGALFDVLIVDEAHHFGQGLRDEALEMCIAKSRLGLTATVPSSSEAFLRLQQIIGPIAYELAIGDLIGTYLADFNLFTLKVTLNDLERKTYMNEINSFTKYRTWFKKACPEADWQDFVLIANRSEEGRRALAALRHAKAIISFSEAKSTILQSLILRHAFSRSIIFTADTVSAYEISKKFLLPVITAEIKKKERESIISGFKSGIFPAIVTCRVLNEGFDVPDADIGIVLGGNLGGQEHVQRIGRILRPKDGKKAVIYELVARNTIEERKARERWQVLKKHMEGKKSERNRHAAKVSPRDEYGEY